MFSVFVSINGGPSELIDYDLDQAAALQLVQETRLESRPGWRTHAWYERQDDE